jgi:hypothetical protein
MKQSKVTIIRDRQPSGGKRSRDKGGRMERSVVKVFQDNGVGAERVPLSGASGGRFSADITVPILGRDVKLECKVRASGFRTIYGWLSDNYGLVVKADRAEQLIVLRLEDFAHLARLSDEDRLRCLAYGVDVT